MAFDPTLLQTYNIVSADYPTVWCYNSGADGLSTLIAANYFSSLVDRVRSGDKLLIRNATESFGLSGTFINDGTTVSVDWDNTLRFQGVITNISGSSSNTYLAVPPAGIITKTYGILWSPVTAGTAQITFSLGGIVITSGGFNITNAGLTGQVFTATPSALNVADGATTIRATSDGGSTTAATMTVGFKIICPSKI